MRSSDVIQVESEEVVYNLGGQYIKTEPVSQQLASGRHAPIGPESTHIIVFLEWAYKYLPVRAVSSWTWAASPSHWYVSGSKTEEFAHLFSAVRIYSQAFHLGVRGFFLSPHCTMDHQDVSWCFKLFLEVPKGSTSLAAYDEFAAWSKEDDVNMFFFF